jgi:hypothetical protein
LGPVIVRLKAEDESKSKDEVLSLLDVEVAAFSDYMARLDSPARGALSHPEMALLKTYLVAKLRERL